MTSPFAGSWKHTENENFDDLLKAMDVGMLARQAIKSSHPTQVWTVTGDKYHITTSGLKTTETNFEIGKEFTEEGFDGKEAKCLVTKENDHKLVQSFKGPNRELKITREVNGDILTITFEVLNSSVKATRKFKRN